MRAYRRRSGPASRDAKGAATPCPGEASGVSGASREARTPNEDRLDMRKRLTDRKRTARTSWPGASGWGRRRRRIQCIRTHKASPSEPNKVLLESGGKRRQPRPPSSAPFVTVRDVGRLTIIYHLVYTGADGPLVGRHPRRASRPRPRSLRRLWLRRRRRAADLRRRRRDQADPLSPFRQQARPPREADGGPTRSAARRAPRRRRAVRRSRRRADGDSGDDLRLRRRRAHVLSALSHALVRAGPQRSL